MAALPLGCAFVVMVRYAILVQEDEVVVLVIKKTYHDQIQVKLLIFRAQVGLSDSDVLG